MARHAALALTLAALIATTSPAYAVDDPLPAVPTGGACQPAVTDCPTPPTPAATPPPSPAGAQNYHLQVAGPAANRLTMTTIPTPIGGGDFGAPVLQYIADQWVRTYTTGIAPTIVTDTRPGRLPWALIGQVGPLHSTTGAYLPGKHIGWTPALPISGTAMGTNVGAPIAPGFLNGGNGLGDPRTLAEAPLGHNGDYSSSITVGGTLIAWIPDNAPTGDYAFTLTLSLIG